MIVAEVEGAKGDETVKYAPGQRAEVKGMGHSQHLQGVANILECVRVNVPDTIFGQVEARDGGHGRERVLLEVVDSGIYKTEKKLS